MHFVLIKHDFSLKEYKKCIKVPL